jgi:hypothetical protein
MGDLGNLGQRKVREETSFGWFGVRIRTNPKLTDLVLMDFAEGAANIDEDSPEAMTFVKRQMQLAIHPEDFDAFWLLALENGQETIDLMGVMKRIVENATKRPTSLPSDSSAGQPRTVVTSPDVSSLPATGDSPLTAMDRQAIETLPGRPELALVIDRAARERAATG